MTIMADARPAMTPRHPAPRTAQRRQLLLGSLGAIGLQTLGLPAVAQVDPPLGWLRPRAAAPDTLLTDAEGRSLPLRERLLGRTTAVQLMFTGCTTTCPTQGALFALMADQLRSEAPPAWLSISIDALGDDSTRLARWQQRLGPHPRWSAAVPPVREVDALAAFLRGGSPRTGTHTNQVFVFDRQARLAYRTGDDPTPAFLQSLLSAVG